MVKKKSRKHPGSKKSKSILDRIKLPDELKARGDKNVRSLDLKTDFDIAMDFATRLYNKFNKLVKSVIMFGSSVKKTATTGSDIDIVIIIDDASVLWDQELIAWYRTELDKILSNNPYSKSLHINTIKLSTWWEDLIRGDPTVINMIRYGESIIDLAGFFEPLKHLLIKGKIKSTPEAVYNALQRAPTHLLRSKASELNSIEGLYWCMVDAAHAALISANISPPSPEHIPIDLKETFVDQGKLKMKYVIWYRDLLMLHKKIMHGEVKDLKGIEIDNWQQRTEDFLQAMIRLVDEIVSAKK
jgi:predicted nucleotidyltransferase/uncharacterized protein (UPF0332 family)